ncbi:alpha/beta hydrolase family protein [Rhizobium sp. SL86]|uniref:alpha/beta hydrolase family protein n=1 Tax=Rhizobium sp. SL86 TaxID=2995148 RepID=UPI002275ECB8|nr:dienelactone hydrolase [Rhizobium sp. SL86]MCY1668659.1 dienelactone hydrolase [Rhizobium sp. SL86]
MKPARFALVMTLLLPTTTPAEENRVDRIRPDAPELAAYGPHDIGVRTISLSNPDQLDVLKVKPGQDGPRYDRPLTVEVWYPARVGQAGGVYRVFMRDGKTEVSVAGRAVRDAEPAKAQSGERYPLVIVSHGYPGNRYLLSPLAENLASKGYVVASIDHTDSTYNDRAAFGSTLVNRPLDQHFILGEIARLSSTPDSFLAGLVDAERVGLVGYSMGAYGAVISAGAGVSDAAVKADWSAPDGLLAKHQAGTESHAGLFDPRLKAVIAIAPWGMQRGMWDEKGLAELKVPIFFMAGSSDDVSDYDKGIRPLFEGAKKVDRYLLTFDNAKHNAAAPMPAPVESWAFNKDLGFAPFEHYADPVWDSVRMNNIAQHFATAWFDRMLKGDATKDRYLDLVERSKDGVHAIEKDGTVKPEHSYWAGFRNRTAEGLRLEHRLPQ